MQWCDPFARNRHKPGDGRQRSRVRLVSNGHQATLIFDNCVSTSVRCTHYSLHRNRPNINSDRPQCRGDSITLRQVNASEGAMRRRQAEPAYAGYGPKGRGRPKRDWSQVLRAKRRKTAPERPGVKHPPKATQNGHMEQGNPSRALSALCRSRRPGRMP